MDSPEHGFHRVGLRGESLILFRMVWGADTVALFQEIERSVLSDPRLRHTVFKEAGRLHRHTEAAAAELEVPDHFARRLALLAAAEGAESDPSCFVEACIGRLARDRAS